MKLSDFDYDLPTEQIAQYPEEKRENSRMMVLHRSTGRIEHRYFYDILEYINPGDCFVLNDSRVIPARLFGVKEKTGAKIEVLIIRRLEGDVWEALVKPGKRLKTGDIVGFSQNPKFQAEVVGDGMDGTRKIRFLYQGIFQELLEQFGNMPLPPYINRENELADKDRYQTVYCKYDGSVAAPTAGLHFTRALLEKIREKGAEIHFVTLHVGIGTFRPVKTEEITEHVMHYEEYVIDAETANAVNRAKQEGRRVISVGTTSTRTLESAADENGMIRPGRRSTNLYIYPPKYQFKVVDGLITNFHLPKSTLLMLISAFYDREKILEAYKIAVEEKYRFFSYGDAMFIE